MYQKTNMPTAAPNIRAIVKPNDDAADIAFNLYREAGVGSADHVWNASS
jgi:hypothetical protein